MPVPPQCRGADSVGQQQPQQLAAAAAAAANAANAAPQQSSVLPFSKKAAPFLAATATPSSSALAMPAVVTANAAASTPPPLTVQHTLRATQLQWGRLLSNGCELGVDLIRKFTEDTSPSLCWPCPARPVDFLQFKLTAASTTATYVCYSPVHIDTSGDAAYALVAKEDRGYDLVRIVACSPTPPHELGVSPDQWRDAPPFPVFIRRAAAEEVTALQQEHVRAEKWMYEQMQRAVDQKKICVTAVEFRFDGKELVMLFDAEGNGPEPNELRGAEAKLTELLGLRVRMNRAQEDPPATAIAAAATLPVHQKPTFLPAFRDPSTSNMITFEFSPVNGLRYWVNDSERPPLQSISLLVRNSVCRLWFVEQDRGITLPNYGKGIISELAHLANLAKIPHNLPTDPAGAAAAVAAASGSGSAPASQAGAAGGGGSGGGGGGPPHSSPAQPQPHLSQQQSLPPHSQLHHLQHPSHPQAQQQAPVSSQHHLAGAFGHQGQPLLHPAAQQQQQPQPQPASKELGGVYSSSPFFSQGPVSGGNGGAFAPPSAGGDPPAEGPSVGMSHVGQSPSQAGGVGGGGGGKQYGSTPNPSAH
eukprot:Rhum_TRINITY_DN14316_c5_g2::Rhum_TRINITY_DN14316_c5_g2_i1::g.82364::m.82364